MLKRLSYGTVGIALMSLSVFFAVITLYIVRSEVWPAVQNGTLNVRTNSMILNIVWEGNEIYLLLTVYVLLAIGSAYGAIRAFGAAIRRR